MRVYWWQSEHGPNFGDALTEVLLSRLAGIDVEWAIPGAAQLFGIGSNLEMIPDGFDGIVWGVGTSSEFSEPGDDHIILRPRQTGLRIPDLSAARVVCLRGAHTALRCGPQSCLLADPGLLASDLLASRPIADVEHGVIAHIGDDRPVPDDSLAIDVQGGVDFVLAQAARCRSLTVSSLHALILADSLGIPVRWSPFPTTTALKFYDYVSALGETIEPMVWRIANQKTVEHLKCELRSTLAILKEIS